MSDETADNICWAVIGLATLYFSVTIVPHVIDQIIYDIVGY